MSRRRHASLGSEVLVAAMAAATTWAAMLSWRGFTEDAGVVAVQLVVVAAVVAAVGALTRWLGVPVLFVLPLQAATGLAVVSGQVTGRPWPDEQLRAALEAGSDAARLYAAPVPVVDGIGVQPLMLLGGLAAMLLVDLLAAGLRRVPLAGLPLLVVYSVPVGVLGGGLAWWVFGLTATGFLLMLYLQEERRVDGWGRGLDDAGRRQDGGEGYRRGGAVRGGALTVGAVATLAAVVVPVGVPTLQLSVFDFGTGNGSGDRIELTNPIVNLRDTLNRGDDIPLVVVETDDPDPRYLRTTVLTRFGSNRWSPGDRDVPTSNVPRGEMPSLPGVDPDLLGETYDYHVEVQPQFESTWLPTQAPITSITAPGAWRFDEATRDFLATDDDTNTAGLEYDMTAVDVDYRRSGLAAARSGVVEVGSAYTALPSGVPAIARNLARSVTAGAEDDLERAALLQDWFRRDGGFEYSLTEAPDASVGTDALAAFLSEDGRVGYCEQFAASMAVMARVLDIPSRVAVGFLAPDEDPAQPGRWVYSAHDLHAWVELYFPGSGWVLFDPTPPARVPDVPAYSEPRAVGPEQLPTNRPEQEPTRESTAAPSAAPEPTDRPRPQDLAADESDDEAGTGVPLGRVLGVLLTLAVLAAVLVGPRLVRTRRSERRRSGGPEEAWAELHDLCVDLGVPWPEDRSPREVRAALALFTGRETAALERLADGVERARYARPGSQVVDPLQSERDLGVVRDALLDRSSPAARRRATWWPRSLFRRSAVAAAPTGDAPAERGELVGRH